MKQQLPTACFCNGAVTSWHKVLSSFNACLPEGSFVSLDRAQLRKPATSQTQTLAAMPRDKRTDR